MILGTNKKNEAADIFDFCFYFAIIQGQRSVSRSKMFFLTNKATSRCNTSISCNFDWEILFLYYFNDSRLSSRSKSQFQDQIVENDFFGVILTTESIYQIIMVTQGHIQDQNVYSKGLGGIL